MALKGKEKQTVDTQLIKEWNDGALITIKNVTEENKILFSDMRTKISNTFKITVGLYIALFILGFLLLSVPIWYAYTGQIAVYNSIITGTLGITNLVVLFLFKPVERIHDLMSDLSQITLLLNNYRQQEALILYQFNSQLDSQKKSASETVQNIREAASNSVNLLEQYCEMKLKE